MAKYNMAKYSTKYRYTANIITTYSNKITPNWATKKIKKLHHDNAETKAKENDSPILT